MTTKSKVAPVVGEIVEVETKVSKKVVDMLAELTEYRAMRTEADDRVEELRQAIFAQVGKQEQSLRHHNLEVGRISKTEKNAVDVKKLKTEFPEIYELVLAKSESFTIGTVAKRNTK
jgi:predicted phage-related endonuclease